MGFIGRLKFNRRFFAGLLVVLVFFGVFGEMSTNAQSIFVDPSERNGGTFWEVAKNSFIHPFTVNDASDLPLAGDDGYGLGEGDDAVNSGLLDLSAWLVQKASDLVMWTVSSKLYNDVFFSEGARRALSFIWGVVRDFVNMFYLLVLIFLAITTILRVNKFSDKKLFFNVIVSAILVNFSLPITLVVIDFSNMVMDFFATAIMNTLSGQDIGTFFLDKTNYAVADGVSSLLKIMGVSIVQFIIEVVMAVMLFFTAISLLVRLVAYWVLIILSPLAFFSIALPSSGSFQEWKDKLLNYSFYGPIMLFFIWVSLLLLVALDNVLAVSGQSDTWLTFIVSYITVLYLLYYGHDKSKSMAAKAGDTVSKIMTKGGDYAVKAGKGAAMLTPLGWGAAAGMGAKSWAGSQFTGMKARMNEGRWTRLATEEGRKEAKEETDLNAKIRSASPERRQVLEMQRAEKNISNWKESGRDIENLNFLHGMLNDNSVANREAAALQLTKLGKLGITNDGRNIYSEVKAIAAANNNNILDRATERAAGKENKVARYMHHYENFHSGNATEESTNFVNDNITRAMELYNNNIPDNMPGLRYDPDDAAARQAFIQNEFNNNDRSAMVSGVLSQLNSNTDIAKVINEQKQEPISGDVSNDVADFLTHDQLGGNQFSHRGREVILDQSHSNAQTILSRRGVV